MKYQILVGYNQPEFPDYPDTGFLNVPNMHKQDAEALATILNKFFANSEENCDRYNIFYQAVPEDYKLLTYGCDF